MEFLQKEVLMIKLGVIGVEEVFWCSPRGKAKSGEFFGNAEEIWSWWKRF
jgi:hypothetical protein|tara:strand:+ start:304 stop:453 length:150 start_codon:yes stop_codon:yes gene_type:complete